jgi:hypothetical protein
MLTRFAVLAILLLTLAGCVLQSREPVFSDAQSSLALGASAVTMRSYSWKDGEWTEDKERLALTVEGRHYVAKEDKSSAGIAFIPLSGDWFAVQATEAAKPTNYTLATVKDGVAVFHLLECADLKKRAELAAYIDYQRDDCFIKEGVAAMALFGELVKQPGEPSAKIEPLLPVP